MRIGLKRFEINSTRKLDDSIKGIGLNWLVTQRSFITSEESRI